VKVANVTADKFVTRANDAKAGLLKTHIEQTGTAEQ
jgi:hypothetical protein